MAEEDDEGLDTKSKMFKQAEEERQARRQRAAATRQRSGPLTGIEHLAEFVMGPSGRANVDRGDEEEEEEEAEQSDVSDESESNNNPVR